MEESWDDEFALDDAKVMLEQRSSTIQSSVIKLDKLVEDDGSDWMEEFQDEDDKLLSSPGKDALNGKTVTVIGVNANPFETEDWNLDQDLDVETQQFKLQSSTIKTADNLTPRTSMSKPTQPKVPDLSTVTGVKPSVQAIPDEDWDAEMFGDSIDRAEILGLLQKEFHSQPSNHELDVPSNQLPLAHALPKLSNFTKILKFPKAPHLFSLRFADGTKYLKEINVETWILQLVSKHASATRDPHHSAEMIKDLSSAQPLGPVWRNAIWFQFVDLYRHNLLEDCRELVLNFFLDVEHGRLDGVLADILDLALKFLSYAAKMFGLDSLSPNNGVARLRRESLSFALHFDVMLVESQFHHVMRPISELEFAYCSIYQEILKQANQLDAATLNVLKVSVLVDLQCISMALSPLTTETIDFSKFENDNESDTSSIIHDTRRILADADFRLREILELYKLLPVSFLKAKTAYILGVGQVQSRQGHIAEQQLLECLFILDEMPNLVKNSPPILSTLGYNALKQLSSVFVGNQKSRYAIAALESAQRNLSLRQKELPFSPTLAQMCADSKFSLKAVRCFLELIGRCKEARRLNEYVHMTIAVSEVLMEIGKHRFAERLLQEAVDLLLDERAKSSPSQNLHVSTVINVTKLRYQLSQAYCALGKHAENVILLETCLFQNTTPGLLPKMLLSLAASYKALSWQKEALEVFSLFKQFQGDEALDLCILNFAGAVSTEFQRVLDKIATQSHGSNIDLERKDRVKAFVLVAEILCDQGFQQDAIRLLSKCLDDGLGDNSEQIRFYFERGLVLSKCKSHYNEEDIGSTSSLHKSASSYSLLPPKTSQNRKGSMTKLSSRGRSSSHLFSAPNLSSLSEEELLIFTMDSLLKSATIASNSGREYHRCVAMTYHLNAILEALLSSSVLQFSSAQEYLDKLNSLKTMNRRLSLEALYQDTSSTLQSAISLNNVMLMISGYLSMSELLIIQGSRDKAKLYVDPCIDLLWTYFFTRSESLLVGTLDERALSLLSSCLFRLARCFVMMKDIEFVKSNVFVFDALFRLEKDLKDNRRFTLSEQWELEREKVLSGSVRFESHSISKGTPPPLDHIFSKQSEWASNETEPVMSYGRRRPSKSARMPVSRIFGKEPEDTDSMHTAEESDKVSDGSITSLDMEFDQKTFIGPSAVNSKATKILKLRQRIRESYLILSREFEQAHAASHVVSEKTAAWRDAMQQYYEHVVQDSQPADRIVSYQTFPTFATLSARNPHVHNALYSFNVGDFMFLLNLGAGLSVWQRMNYATIQAVKPHGSFAETPEIEPKRVAMKSFKSHKKAAGTHVRLKLIFQQRSDCFAIVEAPLNCSLDDCIAGLLSAHNRTPSNKSLDQVSSNNNVDDDRATLSSSSESSDASITPPASQHPSKFNSTASSVDFYHPKEVRTIELSREAKAFIEIAMDGMLAVRTSFRFGLQLKGKSVLTKLPFSSTIALGETEAFDEWERTNSPYVVHWTNLHDSFVVDNYADDDFLAKKKLEISALRALVEESRLEDSNKFRQENFVNFSHDFNNAFASLKSVLSKQLFALQGSHIIPFLCSYGFSIYPWELLLQEFQLVRTFSLDTFSKQEALLASGLKSPGSVHSHPKLLGFYYAESSVKYRLDKQRRHVSFQKLLHELTGRRSRETSGAQLPSCQTPFQCPLVKQSSRISSYKSRYKYIKFIDFSTADGVSSSPTQISRMYSRHSYPVFILTFADLAEMNSWVKTVFSISQRSSIVFVPGVHTKAVVLKLKQAIDELLTMNERAPPFKPSEGTSARNSGSSSVTSAARRSADISTLLRASASQETSAMSDYEQMYWRQFIRNSVHTTMAKLGVPIQLFETPCTSQ